MAIVFHLKQVKYLNATRAYGNLIWLASADAINCALGISICFSLKYVKCTGF